MSVTREQAQEFLNSLYPCGDQCYLSNHTRTFFSGMIGHVPKGLTVYGEVTPDCLALAKALMGIADQLDKNINNEGPF